MHRYEIINHLIKKNNYKSYLEIGTQGDVCLREVNCILKVGVDPEPVFHSPENCNKFFRKLSDDFFCKNNSKFDIIFIDGMHESSHVFKDVLNSLDILNDGGTIIIHDCNPLTEEAQTKAINIDGVWEIPHLPTWNGDVWRAWVRLRNMRDDLFMYVVDADQGCGVIQRGKQAKVQIDIPFKEVTYKQLRASRKEWLNLITVEEFMKL